MKTTIQQEINIKPTVKKLPVKAYWRKILKTGIITWIGLLLIWTIAAYFSDPQFLPSPLAT
ncbi:hypothetical protein, partial [Mesorhizobium sp. M7A.F.Ca.MR.362.00.0.0]